MSWRTLKGWLGIILSVAHTGCSNPSTSCLAAQAEVSIALLGEASYLRARTDGGEWTTPDSGHEGEYSFCAGDRYEVVSVCETVNGKFADQRMSSTVAEETHLDLSPCQSRSVTVGVTVGGRMTQPGRVTIGANSLLSQVGNWAFEFDLNPGVSDLVASDAFDEVTPRTGKAAFRLGQRFDLSQSVGVIDLNVEGIALG